jgi:hypothetical protein
MVTSKWIYKIKHAEWKCREIQTEICGQRIPTNMRELDSYDETLDTLLVTE